MFFYFFPYWGALLTFNKLWEIRNLSNFTSRQWATPLTALFVYRPWAGHALNWGDWVCNRDPGDIIRPRSYDHCLLCFCSTHSSARCRTGSHGTALWRGRRANQSQDTALWVSNDGHHDGLLRGISHCKFVTCSCSVSVNTSVCLSGRFDRQIILKNKKSP